MEEKILTILRDINPYVDIDRTSELIEEEILDSMGLLLLITELEKEYQIEISLDDLQADDFENLDNIVALVKRHLLQ
ncbi:phosphopantetheine-binding protein [Lachnospiraceae bacterium 66-29]|jgi:Phosphopantetheine attachment site.